VSGKDLKRLFLAHRQEIQAFLNRKLRDVDLAADLTQETFIRFAQRGGEAAVLDDKFYLYRTAHNLAIDHVRARQRRKTVTASHDQLADIREDKPSVEDAFAAREELDRLETIVAELPLLTRRVFLLTKVKGMTHAATADFLGVSPSSVQKHLNQALQHVMRRLKT
jgi:RNA polymerase sigma factor (sigma-70 family)